MSSPPIILLMEEATQVITGQLLTGVKAQEEVITGLPVPPVLTVPIPEAAVPIPARAALITLRERLPSGEGCGGELLETLPLTEAGEGPPAVPRGGIPVLTVPVPALPPGARILPTGVPPILPPIEVQVPQRGKGIK